MNPQPPLAVPIHGFLEVRQSGSLDLAAPADSQERKPARFWDRRREGADQHEYFFLLLHVPILPLWLLESHVVPRIDLGW